MDRPLSVRDLFGYLDPGTLVLLGDAISKRMSSLDLELRVRDEIDEMVQEKLLADVLSAA
jgi:hypothetical protein